MKRLIVSCGITAGCAVAVVALYGYAFRPATTAKGAALFSVDPGAEPSADTTRNVSASLKRLAQLQPGEEQSGMDLRQPCLDLLIESARRLQRHDDYICRFRRQERVDGDLLDAEEVVLSIRHEPFSASMYWPESGRHVVWVDGQHGGKMLVNVGGGSWFLSRLKIAPDSPTVMAEARYPITQVGLLNLTRRVMKYRQRDMTLAEGTQQWRLEVGEELNGHDCYKFTILYDDPKTEPVYRKTLLYFDRETLLPVCVRTFGWPQDVPGADPEARDDQTLLEDYVYHDVQFDQGLTDEDFSLANPPTLADASDE